MSSSNRPFKSVLVGIAGGSASGKSTFAAALEEVLRGAGLTVEIVGTDRYFSRDVERGPTFTSPSSGQVMFNANHPDSADYARVMHDLNERCSAEDAPHVIIVEGLMVLHTAVLRERLDLRLFVELDADQRALRRLLRDIKGGRGGTEPEGIATYYLECARVGHALYVEPSRVYADLIIRGDSDFARTASLVAPIIQQHERLQERLHL